MFTQPFKAKRLDKPWGWEIHWTPTYLPYVGKLLHINKGARLSLQSHELKKESWLLVNGRAKVVWEDDTGQLVENELQPHTGYTCLPGQKHRLAGITECEIFEVSTPEAGTTWRHEDDYHRPNETPEQRAIERPHF